MLQIVVPEQEYWNESKNEFIYTKEQTLCLEHSLVSLSKWEAKWKKSFLKTFGVSTTEEEVIDYVKCMTLTQNVDPNVYSSLTPENMEEIYKYIDDPMTATTINEEHTGISREIITSEVVYQWMIALNIPFECKKWHFNRLMTLIRVCNIKNTPQKKKSADLVNRENASLNELRRKQMNTKG